MAFYVNGNLGGSTSSSLNLPNTTEPVWIGCLDGGDYFQGAIDEVSLYSIALSARQVLSHYYAGLAGN